MARMDGTINQPEDVSQRRQNAAYAHALRYARERYTPEAHIVELVDKTRAADNDAERQAPRASIWHALIALDDGRHAVVGARIGPPTDADHGAKRDEHGDWSVFEVSPPALSDPRGA
jgi:hypothetical protein